MGREGAGGKRSERRPKGDRGTRSSGEAADTLAGREGQEPLASIIKTMRQALEKADPRPENGARAAEKKNYVQRLSNHIATCFANLLRKGFKGILPDERGGKQESPARTSRGLKKLDVNYSTSRLGLALGVSIKTINYRDAKTKRYTKNYSRNDNELRAEATDYHQRQPYAVLIAILFLPIDSCDDVQQGSKKEKDISSFGAAVSSYFPHIRRGISPNFHRCREPGQVS